MKVKLTTSLSGAHGAFRAGDEYECSAAEAKRLIAAGYAEPIAAPGKKLENATKKRPAAETRAAPAKRGALAKLADKAKSAAKAALS